MATNRRRQIQLLAAALLAAAFGTTTPVVAQGIVLPGVGPVNRSMAGASTGAPIDAAGALHWNPASISGLPQSEMILGVELSYPQVNVSSQIHAGALGNGLPGTTLYGTTHSDSGVTPLPTVALVYKPEESPWTFGVGLFTIGGVSDNLAGSPNNPVVSTPPPRGFGGGPIYSRLGVLQVAPTASYQLTDQIAVGFSPTITIADLQVNPFAFAAPNDANGDGFPSYSGGTNGRLHWGGGFQAGIYYTPDPVWSFGLSFKSPQWFEKFQFASTDEVGAGKTVGADFQYPMIISTGVGYRGVERLLVAADLRWVDYQGTQGFKDTGFAPDGSVKGLGWKSVFSVSVGAQYQLTDELSVRAGYLYTGNPIPADQTFLNLAAPALYQHVVALGATYQMNKSINFSLAYLHAFDAEISGPFETPAGPIPGTSATIHTRFDVVIAGVAVRF